MTAVFSASAILLTVRIDASLRSLDPLAELVPQRGEGSEQGVADLDQGVRQLRDQARDGGARQVDQAGDEALELVDDALHERAGGVEDPLDDADECIEGVLDGRGDLAQPAVGVLLGVPFLAGVLLRLAAPGLDGVVVVSLAVRDLAVGAGLLVCDVGARLVVLLARLGARVADRLGLLLLPRRALAVRLLPGLGPFRGLLVGVFLDRGRELGAVVVLRVLLLLLLGLLPGGHSRLALAGGGLELRPALLLGDRRDSLVTGGVRACCGAGSGSTGGGPAAGPGGVPVPRRPARPAGQRAPER